MLSINHDEAMAEVFNKDKDFFIALLNNILDDGVQSQAELLITLRQMAKAFGGLNAVAENAHLNKTQLYNTLSADGNPVLSNFFAILKAMNLRFHITV